MKSNFDTRQSLFLRLTHFDIGEMNDALNGSPTLFSIPKDESFFCNRSSVDNNLVSTI